MSGNFAPYQDVSPDIVRTLSPPPTKSPSPRPKPQSQQQAQSSNNIARAISPPTSPSYQNSSDFFNPGNGWPTNPSDLNGASRSGGDSLERGYGASGAQRSGGGIWGTRSGVDLYETSLGIRLDWEACLAYLAVPPAGAIVLLIFEHRSDYVRFHAWQSTLTFSALLIIHIIFSWSSVFSWLLFIGDLFLIGHLTRKAYKDAETIDRYQVPVFGRLANSIVDDE